MLIRRAEQVNMSGMGTGKEMDSAGVSDLSSARQLASLKEERRIIGESRERKFLQDLLPSTHIGRYEERDIWLAIIEPEHSFQLLDQNHKL